MASNYWISSQMKNWIFIADPDFLSPSILPFHGYCLTIISQITICLNWHYIVGATATVFFNRFYLKQLMQNKIKPKPTHSNMSAKLVLEKQRSKIFRDELDPKLVALTCLYLAAKVEEMGQIQCELIIHGFNLFLKKIKVYKTKELKGETEEAELNGSVGGDADKKQKVVKLTNVDIEMLDTLKQMGASGEASVLELIETFQPNPPIMFKCEMRLLKALDCDLVVYHPYSSIQEYCDHFASFVVDLRTPETQLASDTSTNAKQNTDLKQKISQKVMVLTYRTVNDSYKTDVLFFYPPYIITLSAIYIAVEMSPIQQTSTEKDQGQVKEEPLDDQEVLLQVSIEELTTWLEHLNVNLVIVVDCVTYLLEYFRTQLQVESGEIPSKTAKEQVINTPS